MGIRRADVTRDCLCELRLWPGCESVAGIAVLSDSPGNFTLHVTDYGAAKKKLADRALLCVHVECQPRGPQTHDNFDSRL